MSNKNQYKYLVLVLTVALILGLILVGNKAQKAHIKSIEKTIEQQFMGRK